MKKLREGQKGRGSFLACMTPCALSHGGSIYLNAYNKLNDFSHVCIL